MWTRKPLIEVSIQNKSNYFFVRRTQFLRQTRESFVCLKEDAKCTVKQLNMLKSLGSTWIFGEQHHAVY